MMVNRGWCPRSWDGDLQALVRSGPKPGVQAEVTGVVQPSEKPSAVVPENVLDKLEFHWLDVPNLVRGAPPWHGGQHLGAFAMHCREQIISPGLAIPQEVECFGTKNADGVCVAGEGMRSAARHPASPGNLRGPRDGPADEAAVSAGGAARPPTGGQQPAGVPHPQERG